MVESPCSQDEGLSEIRLSSKWRHREGFLVDNNEGLDERDIGKTHLVIVFKTEWKGHRASGRHKAN
jgi:hypothetical protein